MGLWCEVRAVGLWWAGLAIGFKVILAAFAAAPWHLQMNGILADLPPLVICSGSGFLVDDWDEEGEPPPVKLPLCPLCVAAAFVALAEDPNLPLSLFFFAILLASLAGLDRPRKERPVPSGFSSRAPPPAL